MSPFKITTSFEKRFEQDMVEVLKVAYVISVHQKIQWQNWTQLCSSSQDDWQRQVDTMQKKNASMREALAKSGYGRRS